MLIKLKENLMERLEDISPFEKFMLAQTIDHQHVLLF